MGRGTGSENQAAAAPRRGAARVNSIVNQIREERAFMRSVETPQSISDRRQASLVFNDQEQVWKVLELRSDSEQAHKTVLEVADPSDRSAVSSAYAQFIAECQEADRRAGYAVAA